MKRITLAVLLLALAVPAQAATFNFNFSQTHTLHTPCDTIGTVSNGGITAKFGECFVYAQSLDAPGAPSSCLAFTQSWNGAPGTLQPGIFDNAAPAGAWACRMNGQQIDGCPASPGSIDCRSIRFPNKKIRYFKCDISGVTRTNVWTCEPFICSTDNGATWNTHCRVDDPNYFASIYPDSRIEMILDPDTFNPKGATTPQYVDGYVGCYTEPPSAPNENGPFDWSASKSPFCQWQTIEVYSPVPVDRVWFHNLAGAFYQPLFIDNIVATDGACPNPPCQFEGPTMSAGTARIERQVETGIPRGIIIGQARP